ncbi:MAG TPA: YebC/PmpR family DNA-binding transcriptional regulator [Bacillota bacterium]|nr:YebC/PmpR family DNA-binding transcriptional regulator [Bacillota bacterium]
MAGHSKWSNIKRRKGAQDAKKGKIFMRHAKDIYIAAKEGGGDASMNAALRLAVDKARADNMPNDNIERAIKKATGTLEGVTFEEITYEGYGPGGVAIIVDVLTDNRNRTAAEIRHAFSKNEGNLGATGCVSYLFDRKGYIVILKNDDIDEDELTMEAIEAGADDIEVNEEVFEIYTDPSVFGEVCEKLQEAGYALEDAEISLIPQTYTELPDDEEEKMLALVDMLEEYEDVQDVHHNLLIGS